MIVIKNQQEIESMKRACQISAQALRVAGEAIKPGVTTAFIDRMVADFIRSQGAVASFLHYNGFPASTCVSLNDVVIHGIPSELVVVKEGDIVGVDVGAYIDGFHGDNAYTFTVGAVSERTQLLLSVTQECLALAVEQAVVGNRIGDIASAIQKHAESFGFGVVKEFTGHGIGRDMHEDPSVPNYGRAGFGPRLQAGMTLAIEPMITQGSPKIHILDDDWTVKTNDGSNCAHFEHTVLVSASGPVILTRE